MENKKNTSKITADNGKKAKSADTVKNKNENPKAEGKKHTPK